MISTPTLEEYRLHLLLRIEAAHAAGLYHFARAIAEMYRQQFGEGWK